MSSSASFNSKLNKSQKELEEKINKDFGNVDTSIKEATVNLTIACSVFRDLYNMKQCMKEFDNLRKDITKHARVYCEKVLPITSLIIQSIKDCMESYDGLSFEQFKDNKDVLSNEANQTENLALYIYELNTEILVDFKKEQNKVNTLVFEDFESREPSNNGNEALDVKTKFIKCHLCPPIENFIEALNKIVGFYNSLKENINMLVDLFEKPNTIIVYNKFVRKAKSIEKNCNDHMKTVPTWVTDLKSIGNDDSQEYIERWIFIRKVSSGEKKGKTLFDLGKELCFENKRVKKLLESY
ncbi:34545_t:CDS:1 [Gigaspora margarita]|uniref:34545_t:CDS:1 n=1 Tax=Gigaspora margarita TaxID=4874 RepID=A0ABM8VX25_GIGMA|nr:34545_t:CDS:1 [Gigaspora margarita]